MRADILIADEDVQVAMPMEGSLDVNVFTVAVIHDSQTVLNITLQDSFKLLWPGIMMFKMDALEACHKIWDKIYLNNEMRRTVRDVGCKLLILGA